MNSALKDSAARNHLRVPETFIEFSAAACDQPIHLRFEQQVIRYAQRPAVRLLSGDITYAQLNAFANQAARGLLAQAQPKAGPVALLLNQGYESVLWTLAILKAGFCYAPLDQRLPAPVLRAIIANLRPGALIAGSGYHETCRYLVEGGFPIIDAGVVRDEFSAENLDPPISADSAACIFHTSGSTGDPKGVTDCHRNVLHNVLRYTNNLKFAPEDILSLVQNPSFSGTASSLFGALLNGAAVAPFDLGGKGLGTLSGWLRQARVTVFHGVPSIFRQLADPVGRFPDVRLIRLEGDRASTLDIEHYKKNFQDHCVLVNGLGATECGLVRQFFISKDFDPGRSDAVPVGYEVTDVAVRIVDGRGLVLPPGEKGEIVVESRFLATGYWRHPVRTAERFQLVEGGLRRYRTGDLGRMDEDGCLTHLGRADHLIRISGEFVDTTAIETGLLDVPGISQCVVRDFVDRSGERRLCAYVVAEAKAGITVTRLREALSKRVAQRTVPTAFVFLDALPLTPDKKFDYHNLPKPRERPPQAAAYVAPRNPSERALTHIWGSLLEIDQVGIRDPFYDLGGNSLLAVRLIAEIEKTFKKNLPVAELVRDFTIEYLAELLDRAQAPKSFGTLVAIQPRGAKRPFFCVHDFFGDVLCYRRLAFHLGRDRPFYAFEPQGLRDGEEPSENLVDMAAGYIETIQKVQACGPYIVGGLSFGGIVAFEIAQQLRAKGEHVALLALLDSVVEAPQTRVSRARCLLNFFRDFPSWLTGITQLKRRQWSDLIRMKLRAVQLLSQAALGALKQTLGHERADTGAIHLDDVFGFPENYRKVARAQGKALRNYHPKAYAGKITLFRARMQPFFSSHQKHNGWGPLAAGGLDVIHVPSNHLGILQEPHVRVLARQLQKSLNEVDREPEND